MNRLTALTAATVIAATVAVFDLVSAWAINLEGVLLALTLGLFGTAVALFVALLVVGFGERKRIVAGAASSIDLIAPAARAVRSSALAAIALSLVLFANCSASVKSGPSSTSAAMDDCPGLLG